jgi:hypothetical protein
MTRPALCGPAAVVWVLYEPVRARSSVNLISRIGCFMPIEKVVVVWNGEGPVTFNSSELRVGNALVEVIKGSNRGREFGGYQDGLDHLRGSAAGGVCFVNDTAGIHNYLPRFFVDAFVRAALRLRNRRGVCVGHVDRALQTLEIGGLVGESWIRSNLFYLDEPALRSLDWKVYAPEINALVPGAFPHHFFSDALNSSMQVRISRWLFQPGSKSWYAAAPLTDENADFMAGKARAVLQEYYLSMRLSHAGIQISRTDMTALQLFWLKLINRIGRELGILK